MAESAYSTAQGAEISERSTELVLPGSSSSEPQETTRERMNGVNHSDAPYGHAPRTQSRNEYESVREAARPNPPSSSEQRGLPLPGDRGSASPPPAKERPSFWRRIALGRRGMRLRKNDAAAETPPPATVSKPSQPPSPPAADAVEVRIVEPLLQALVSVESKLERSHIELIGRSDQVEQRLTQLWDIEEQLGTLGELQESLAQVSEQQRILESALISQNRTLRWLVGAVLFSLAAAAFVVAAVLR